MNVELLLKVKQHILEEPQRLIMHLWLVEKTGRRKWIRFGRNKKRSFPGCGTAGCIAGWTCILSEKRPDDFLTSARNLLDLDFYQAERLFAPAYWPDEFEDGTNDDGKPETASIAAARIDRFIETEGRE